MDCPAGFWPQTFNGATSCLNARGYAPDVQAAMDDLKRQQHAEALPYYVTAAVVVVVAPGWYKLLALIPAIDGAFKVSGGF